MRWTRRSLLTLFLTATTAGSAFPQVAAGAITGVVRDPAGEPVPGATVTLTHVETRRRRVVVSSADGVYSASSLAPGSYRIHVELAGFKAPRRTGVPLATGA